MKASDDSLAPYLDGVLGQETSQVSVTYLDRHLKTVSTWTGLHLRKEALARAGKIEQEVPAGASVLLVMPAGSDFLTSLLGCFYAGVIAVPLPEPVSQAHSDRLRSVLLAARPAAILCTAANANIIRKQILAAESGLHNVRLIVMDEVIAEDFPSTPRCAGLRQSPDAPVVVQYTSGSTRDPKGVALSSRNILCNAAIVGERWSLAAGKDLSLNWLPHYHDMGLLGGLLYPLLLGGATVQMSPLAFVQHPINWLRAMSTWKGTVSGGPSFAYELSLSAVTDEELAMLDLSHWQVAYCGAEPVPSGLLQRFRERFAAAGLQPAAVHACYGLAETTLYVAGEPSASNHVKTGTSEIVIEPCHLSPETRATIQIVDPETGEPLPDGEVGEIWVTGPSVALGYVSNPGTPPEEDDTFHAMLPGRSEHWLRTGDLGHIGPAGLYVSGRLKDTLIANGTNVSAVDVEWLAAEFHPELNALAAAAVAVPQQDGTEAIALVIEIKTSTATGHPPATIKGDIRRAIRSVYGLELSNILFVKRGSLERTTSGKIRRREIVSRLRSGPAYPEVV